MTSFHGMMKTAYIMWASRNFCLKKIAGDFSDVVLMCSKIIQWTIAIAAAHWQMVIIKIGTRHINFFDGH